MNNIKETKINGKQKYKRKEEIIDKVNEYSFYKKLEKILKKQAKEKKKKLNEKNKNIKIKNKKNNVIIGRVGNGKSTLIYTINREGIYTSIYYNASLLYYNGRLEINT